MSDLRRQATELRNVAKQLRMFVVDHKAATVAADVADRAEQLLADILRTVAEPAPAGPISHKSEWE